MFRIKSSLLLAAVALMTVHFGGAVTVSAQDNSIQELLACDKIKDPADKLECFNAAIEILKQEEAEKSAEGGNIRSLNKTTNRAGDFGLSREQLAQRANRGETKSADPKQQVFTISRSWRDAIGKYYFLMTNGQIWKEIGGSHLTVPKRAKTLRVKKNVMGGYHAFVEGMNGRRGNVKRVR